MTGTRTVLISGAGVAGTALAFWMHRHGWSVTLVERAPALRTSGQNIDVRGAGREVARRMGIEERIAAAGTGEEGTRFVDDRGRVIAEFPAGHGDSDGATAELEILRGDLVGLLAGLTEDDVAYRYGDSIETVTQDDTGVTVSFASGGTRVFDLLVIAEGIRSRTRARVFGSEIRTRDLGQYVAYGTIARTSADDAWWRWHSVPGGRAVMLRPDNAGTTRASLAYLTTQRGVENLEPASQVAALRAAFAGAGWETPRILDGFAAPGSDFYLDRVAQIHAPAWSRGRIALLGDAAYCASPISGMGTSLSLTGAYILAGELAGADHLAALRSYETLMRPYIDRAQKLPLGAPRLANPKSHLGVQIFGAFLRLAATRPVRAAAARLFTPPADEITLPDYR